MNPDTLIKIDPGYGAVQEKTLADITWLWRSGELPSDARYLNSDGVWQPLQELIEPIIEEEDRQKKWTATTEPPEPIDDSPVDRKPLSLRSLLLAVAGVALFFFADVLWQFVLRQAAHRPDERQRQYERDGRREDLVASHQVAPGMTKEQVERSWVPTIDCHSGTSSGSRGAVDLPEGHCRFLKGDRDTY